MSCAGMIEGPLPFETTRDALLGGRLMLTQPRTGHRAGHDALLLAALAPAQARRIVDLGAGVGTAGLAVLARLREASAHLVELDPATAALARQNAAGNGMSDRCAIVEADVRTLGKPAGPAEPAAQAADLVIANPPFNARAAHQTSPQARRATAHMADGDTLMDWVLAAYRCLKPGGQVGLILRPADLATLLDALAGRFGAAELLPVHARADAPAVRLLVRAVKGRRTPPAIRPGLILAEADGRTTVTADAVLRGEAGLIP